MSRNRNTSHSLFSPAQRGGVLGGKGYNFQDAYIVIQLPVWLADPAFVSYIKEGFDDVDVVFSRDGTRETRHYQLKDHVVRLSEFREVVQRFATAAERPGTNATSFILGCCGLDRTLASIWDRVKELQGARKTYATPALESTHAELLDLLAKHKLSAHADLLLNKVDVDYESVGLRDTNPRVLMERFRGAFMTLPLFRGERHEVLDRLFERLLIRVNKAIRVGMNREEIEGVVRSELAAALKGPAVVVHLHGWARQAYDVPADEEIDWTTHFDHPTLRVPAPATWETELLPSLQAIRKRFDSDPDRRLIWLRARAPLSAGIAFGHAFAEAVGYTIRIRQPTPGAPDAMQYWETDTPVGGGHPIGADAVDGDPTAEDVVVGVGVTDDPRPKIEQYLATTDRKVRAMLYIRPLGGPSDTSINAETVGAFAAAVKREIRRFCNLHNPRLIHLFYFGPLGLAVLLGQKLNGLADIQCYERSKATGYTPSCRLPA